VNFLRQHRTSKQNTNKMLNNRREIVLQNALYFSPKVEDWNWETMFYGHYIGLSSTTAIWSARKSVEFSKKCKI